MKCNKCGYDDGDSGDMAHVCQRPSYRYGEHPTSFGLVKPVQELKCNPHPKAPHGFNRNASHANDRYTCECEGWDAYDAGYQAGVMAGIEASMGQEPEQELDDGGCKACDGDQCTAKNGCVALDNPPPQRKLPEAGDGHDLFYEAVRLLDNAIFAQSGDVVRHDSAAHKEALDFFNHVFTRLDLTPPPQRKPLTDEQIDFLNFLYGAGEWDGVWFEGKHPTKKGAFWWRKDMKRLFDYGIKE